MIIYQKKLKFHLKNVMQNGKYYPFKQGPTSLSNAAQDWVAEMEDEAKS